MLILSGVILILGADSETISLTDENVLVGETDRLAVGARIMITP